MVFETLKVVREGGVFFVGASFRLPSDAGLDRDKLFLMGKRKQMLTITSNTSL